MRCYTVHSRPGEDIVVIREGFSWGAFLFTALWALWHRLWLAFLALAVLLLAVDTATELLGVSELIATAIGLAVSLLIGFQANDWRRRALERRGYVFAGVVAAQDADAALRRYVDFTPDAATARTFA